MPKKRESRPPSGGEPEQLGHRELLQKYGIEGPIEQALIERGEEIRQLLKRSPAKSKLEAWIEAAGGKLDKYVRDAAGDAAGADYLVRHAHQLLSLRKCLWAMWMTEGGALGALESPSRKPDEEIVVRRGLLDYANSLLTPPGSERPPISALAIAGIVAAIEYDRAKMKKTPEGWEKHRKGVEQLHKRMAGEPAANRRMAFKRSVNAALAGQPQNYDQSEAPTGPMTLQDFMHHWEWYAKRPGPRRLRTKHKK